MVAVIVMAGTLFYYGAMDFCIVALLMCQPMSLYGIRQAFRQTLSLFYGASLGNLHLTLGKLQAQGYIEIHEQEEGGRRRTIWRVTKSGRQFFDASLCAPVPPGRMEETILARFHFLGLVPDRVRRLEVLDWLIGLVTEALAGLETQKSGMDVVVVPEAWQDVARYQFATLDYGIMSHRAALDWFRQRREEEASRL